MFNKEIPNNVLTSVVRYSCIYKIIAYREVVAIRYASQIVDRIGVL